MPASFAQTNRILPVMGCAMLLMLGACATLPPPTSELSAAQQAVARADAADADQYAPADLAAAKSALARAQAAMAAAREDDARKLALGAASQADLATALSNEAAATTELAQRQREIADLQQQLQLGVSP